MPIASHFMRWQAPALPQAARFILDRHPDGDLSNLVVALPGGRAGRRLLELLVEIADHRTIPLIPPRITTPGSLADELLSPPINIADATARHMTWTQALQSARPAALRRIIPNPPPPSDLLGWSVLATTLEKMHEELLGHDMLFGDVVAAAADLDEFNDGDRWKALAEIQSAYLRVLSDADLIDPQQFRRESLRQGVGVSTDRDILVVAAVELNPIQRRLLDAVADRVTLLIHADPVDAPHFDAHGCLVVADWCARPIALADEQIVVVDRPAEQAEAVARAIAALDKKFTAEQITVGVADASVAPQLQQLLPTLGLPVRLAAGIEAARTRPFRLLAAIADWLDSRSFSDFATLLRHPDVEAAIPAADPAAVEDWLALLDRYHSDHLQAKLAGDWLGDDKRRRKLKHVHDVVLDLAGDLADGSARSLRQWAQPIVDLILRVYKAPLDRTDEPQRILLEACDQLHGVLAEVHALPEGLSPRTRAAAALQLVAAVAQSRGPIPAEPSVSAIELLGPLELHLDDAPVLLFTGFNEGSFPSSVSADPFMPDRLRAKLNLLDNSRRYARDAYALAAIAASRPHLTLIAGRRGAEGDPTPPSRFMFACESDRIVARARKFYSAPHRAPRPVRPPWKIAEQTRFETPPKPRPLAHPIQRLSVTGFRAYLECPYRFYLSHVLQLKHADDESQELDGGAFGTLAHGVLDQFAAGLLASSTDAAAIDRELSALLDEQVAEKFGTRPLPAVAVQVAQLRARLAAFAAWQADWAAQGWRIHRHELQFRDDAAVPLDVDGSPMLITGTIDRIDRNHLTGEWAVIDYKTGDSGAEPDKVHRQADEWVDLQLPLYRHFVKSLGIEGPIRLGYILLPKNTDSVGFAAADWTDAELDAAMEKAQQVVRDIRAEIFYPPAADPPAFDDFAEICGVGQLLAAAVADDVDGVRSEEE
jgi:ATP-dependent helicase/nuclease subunit B